VRGSEKRIADLVLKESYRQIEVQDGHQVLSLPILQTSFRALAVKAAKGDVQSIRLLAALVADAERSQQAELDKRQEEFGTAILYKNTVSRYIEYHKKHNLAYERPFPHPEHVILDWETFEVTITGPVDRKSFKIRKALINRMAGLEVELGMPDVELEADNNETTVSEHVSTFKAHREQTDSKHDDVTAYTDRQLTRQILSNLRKIIPRDDPDWMEFSPTFIQKWIDYYYYYGPSAHIPEEELLQIQFEKDNPPPFKFNTKIKASIHDILESAEQFRIYMRAKLPELMGDAWCTRLEQKRHELRNVDWDRTRYRYHTGRFDFSEFTDNEEELDMLNNQGLLDEVMAWEED